MDMDLGTITAEYQKIKNNINATPNEMLIQYAWDHGYLYGEHECDFLSNISGRHDLSDAQLQWLRFINQRILSEIVVRDFDPNDVINGFDCAFEFWEVIFTTTPTPLRQFLFTILVLSVNFSSMKFICMKISMFILNVTWMSLQLRN